MSKPNKTGADVSTPDEGLVRRQKETIRAKREEERRLGSEIKGRLRHAKSLEPSDREIVAKNLRSLIDDYRLPTAKLAAHVTGGKKELYRLLPSQQGTKEHRLRADPRKYDGLIRGIRKLTGDPEGQLYYRVFEGTTLHPAGPGDIDEDMLVLQGLGSLIESLDEEFHLIKKFERSAQLSVDYSRMGRNLSWPPLNPGLRKKMDPKHVYWDGLLDADGAAEDVFLEEFVPVLPHIYLGLPLAAYEDQYATWPDPMVSSGLGFHIGNAWEDFLSQQSQDHWYGRVWRAILDGVNEPIRYDWRQTEAGWELTLADGRAPTAWRDSLSKSCSHLLRTEVGEDYKKQLHGEQANGDEDDIPYKPSLWLAAYPNRTCTRLKPVLVYHWAGPLVMDVKPLSLGVLRESRQTRLVASGWETLHDRLVSLLMGTGESEETPIEQELRRTATFVDYNPVLQEERLKKRRAQKLHESIRSMASRTAQRRKGTTSDKTGNPKKSLEDHLRVCDSSVRALFTAFSQRVRNLDRHIAENVWSYGVAYRARQNFVELHFRKSRLEVCMRPADYHDPKNLLGRVPETYEWTLNRRFMLDREEQLDYLLDLVKQSYEDVR